MRKYLSEPVVLNFVTKSPVGLLLNPSPGLLIFDEETLTKMQWLYLMADTVMPVFASCSPSWHRKVP